MTALQPKDSVGACQILDLGGEPDTIHRLDALEETHPTSSPSRLPYAILIFIESALRNCDGFQVTEEDLNKLAARKTASDKRKDLL
jgi:aconitate hydratase